jgi:phosphoribosylformylglycinamidine cyclo-ligase
MTFNLGVGMVAVVPRERAEDALALATERGLTAWRLGEVVPGSGRVILGGDYGDYAATWR